MVAKIISGKSLKGALQYNENKVSKMKAELIGENGFQKDIKNLSFQDKLFRLQDLAFRNERVKTNTLHISLNFANGEQLSKDKLNAIAKDYMERLGFGKQPFLIYQHQDAGHPHIHMVSTNIQSTGKRISLHNLGRTKSEEARKIIEKEYHLIPASKSENEKQDFVLAKVEYGRCETKRAITNVVKSIIADYKFASLAELNAVLKNYNVIADRGSKESRMYQKSGLVYWTLNNKGEKVGVPIKASSIYGSPTLKKLAFNFEKGKEERKPYKSQLIANLDRILITKASKIGFEQALKAKNIEVIFRQNENGKLYGITFIDHHHHTVFKGSDLGKAYSANALESHFVKSLDEMKLNSKEFDLENTVEQKCKSIIPNPKSNSLLETLLKPEYYDHSAFEGLKKKHRNKKRNHTL